MHKLRSKLTVSVGVLGAAAMIAASPATAATPGTGTLVGSGTFHPGHDLLVGRFQTIAFSGTLRGTTTTNTLLRAGAFCSFTGPSTIAETAALGEGNVSGGCEGKDDVTSAAVTTGTCNLHYIRVGNAVEVEGNCSGGAVNGHLVGAFVFEPTSKPFTSYLLQGGVTIS